MFAISLYNFVPSCQICNSRIKGDKFLESYNIDLSAENAAREKLLRLSPVSRFYNFDKSVSIRYIPKIINDKHWNYSPLSQSCAENYEVSFDTNIRNANVSIVSALKLNERYNSTAIKNKGLYLLDLKKRYPASHIQMISGLLSKSACYISPEEIEEAIFHKRENYILLKKLRNDLLE